MYVVAAIEGGIEVGVSRCRCGIEEGKLGIINTGDNQTVEGAADPTGAPPR